MCKHATFLDLPTRINPDKTAQVDNFWICWKGSMTSISEEPTTSTHDLQLGELLHIDFFFIGTVSVRELSIILLIVNAKSRNL